MERVLAQIQADIKHGHFQYGQYFPTSNRAKQLARELQAANLPKMATAPSVCMDTQNTQIVGAR